MVLIHIQITLGGDFQIERAVPRNQLQHMIQEAYACRNFGAAPAIEVYAVYGAEPEVQAYAMAKYSRSALSMKESRAGIGPSQRMS